MNTAIVYALGCGLIVAVCAAIIGWNPLLGIIGAVVGYIASPAK